jgi:hypothetical protein
VFGCLAILVGLISIVNQVQRAYGLRSQIKSNAIVEQEPAETDTDLEDDASHTIVRKLKWELEMASRDLKTLAVRVLCLLFQDVPMVRAFSRAHRPDRSMQNVMAWRRYRAAFDAFGLAGCDGRAARPEGGRDRQDGALLAT